VKVEKGVDARASSALLADTVADIAVVIGDHLLHEIDRH